MKTIYAALMAVCLTPLVAKAEIPAQCMAKSEAFLSAANKFKTEYDAYKPFARIYMDILETRGKGPIVVDDPITVGVMEHMIETGSFHLTANNAIYAAAVVLECIQSQ